MRGIDRVTTPPPLEHKHPRWQRHRKPLARVGIVLRPATSCGTLLPPTAAASVGYDLQPLVGSEVTPGPSCCAGSAPTVPS